MRCVYEWLPIRCPSAAARCVSFIRSGDARFLPSTKNDALTPRRASTSSTIGVTAGSGPLSNERATSPIEQLLLGRCEPERVTVLGDISRRRRREMCPENDDVGVRVFLAECAPRLLGHRAV